MAHYNDNTTKGTASESLLTKILQVLGQSAVKYPLEWIMLILWCMLWNNHCAVSLMSACIEPQLEKISAFFFFEWWGIFSNLIQPRRAQVIKYLPFKMSNLHSDWIVIFKIYWYTNSLTLWKREKREIMKVIIQERDKEQGSAKLEVDIWKDGEREGRKWKGIKVTLDLCE